MLENLGKFLETTFPYIFSKKNYNHIRMTGAILIDAVTAAINVGAPVILAEHIIEEANSTSKSFTEEFDWNRHFPYIACTSALLIAQILPKFRNMLLNPVRANVQKELTMSMLAKSFAIELDHHVTTRTGDFAQGLSKNYSTIDQMIPSLFGDIIPVTMEVLGTTGVLISRYNVFGLVQLGILVLYLSAAIPGEKTAEDIRKTCVEKSYDAYGVIIETMNNYQIAHQFGNVYHELDKNDKVWTQSEQFYHRKHRKEDNNALLLSIINGLGFVGALTFAALMPPGGKFQLVDFALIAYYMTRLNVRLDSLPKSISALSTAIVDSEKIVNFLNRKSKVPDPSNPVILNLHEPPSIEFRNVTFSYGPKEYDIEIIYSVDSNKFDAQLNDWKNKHKTGDLLFVFNEGWQAYLLRNEQKELELKGIDNESVIGKELAEINRKNISVYNKSTLQKLLQTNILFKEHEPKKILNKVNFKVEAKQKVAIVGPTGVGKSSILKLLQRFYPVEDGEIFINGINIAHMSAESLRSNIAVVSQDAALFNGTITENIGYGDLQANLDDIYEAAKFAELLKESNPEESPNTGHAQVNDEDIHEIENVKSIKEQNLEKLKTNVGQHGNKLSGGEKQRAAVARALLRGGYIFLLDEPTSALNAKVENEVQTMLDGLTASVTTLIVTHRLNTIINANQILYLEDGDFVEQGTFDQLMRKGGKFFQEFKVQCEKLGIRVEDLKPVARETLMSENFNSFWQRRQDSRNQREIIGLDEEEKEKKPMPQPKQKFGKAQKEEEKEPLVVVDLNSVKNYNSINNS